MSLNDLIDLLRNGSADRVSEILRTISVDSKLPLEWDGHLGMLSYSPPLISVAAFFAAEKSFNAMVALRPNMDELDFFRTPLTHFAAAGGCIAILQDLFERGMSFTGAGFPAIEHRQLNAVKWMLQNRLIRYGEVDPRGYSHLLVAVENNCFDIVQEFTARYELPFSTGTGYSPICLSLSQDLMTIAEFLIGERSIDINQTDIDGVSFVFPILHCTLLA